MLPKPTVNFVESGHEPSSEEDVRGILSNPIYCGIGPFPKMVEDEKYVSAAVKSIEEDGAEQFVVNMLYLMRKSFDTVGYGLEEPGADTLHKASDEPNPGAKKSEGQV